MPNRRKMNLNDQPERIGIAGQNLSCRMRGKMNGVPSEPLSVMSHPRDCRLGRLLQDPKEPAC